jgi:peroxiredoxin
VLGPGAPRREVDAGPGLGGAVGTRASRMHGVPCMGIAQPGAEAPSFTLHSTPDQTLALSELRGQRVILAFYPADWSPVCGDQLALYNELVPEFRRLGAICVGISVDGVWCHSAYARHRNLRIPLLADFEPKGAVARLFGAYRDREGVAERALFVLDEDGVIRWSYCSPAGINPGADGILEALEALPGRKSDDPDRTSPRTSPGAASQRA